MNANSATYFKGSFLIKNINRHMYQITALFVKTKVTHHIIMIYFYGLAVNYL